MGDQDSIRMIIWEHYNNPNNGIGLFQIANFLQSPETALHQTMFFDGI